jgi:hypothetical protein
MMKYLAILVLLLGSAGALAADGWTNSLKPAGAAAAPLTIVENAQPRYSIVIPHKPTTEEQKAADDLQQWIKEMTGAALPIRFVASGASIHIQTDPSLEPEQYKIAVQGKDLLLSGGKTRGVINAVYAFLEEDLGCRWYTKEDIRLPHSKTLTIAPVPRTYTPQLVLRDPFYFVSFDATWSLRNRTNAPDSKVPEEYGGHMDYDDLFVHTAARLLPPEKYFKDHPEYFAMDAQGKRYSAQLDPTNPDVARIVTENVLKVLKDNPHTEIVSVSKNDSGGDQVCHCPRCEKLRAAEGSEMANQLVLVNHVADEVAKEYPHVLISTLAYLDTVGVPKTARPHKNVIIRLCNDAVGAWVHPFTPARDLPVANIAKQWSAAGARLSIWDYNVNFSHYLAPMPNMDVIADNIRFWTENHAIGVMTQAGYQSTSERDQMRSWVIAKLMWDPSRDVHALMDDFVEGHYGKVAPLIKEYNTLLASAGKADEKELASPPGGIRYPMTIALFSKDFLAKASEIFAQAEQQAADAPDLLDRVQRAELPIMYVKLSQGPVTADLLNRFEQIAKREDANWIDEGRITLDQQLATWRKALPAAAATPIAMPETAAARQEPRPATAAPAANPIVISRNDSTYTYSAFPDACRLSNGDIVCVYYNGYGHVSLAADDFPLGGRICMVRSSDEGRTWSAPQVVFDDVDDNRDPHIAQLDDGSLVCTFFSWQLKGDRLKSKSAFDWKAFPKISRLHPAQMVRSMDEGKTWETTAHTIAPKGFVCSAPVRQLPDGTCVLGLYGSDKANKVEVGATIRSTNRGGTWSAPVIIHAPPGVSLDAETDLIRLTDGRLFAALRSSKQDMHYAISTDEAKSWSEAKDIGFKGHCPHLLRLSSGEIILSHRVPNTSIHISRDDGKTWQGPYQIDSCIGAYPATVELKDHSVLIVYYSEGPGSVIRARRFKVTPDGIEFLPLK